MVDRAVFPHVAFDLKVRIQGKVKIIWEQSQSQIFQLFRSMMVKNRKIQRFLKL